jgi:hypothetical protein
MGTAGTVLLVLGAWLVGSVLLGLLVGRMLRFGHLRPGRSPAPRPDPRADPHPRHDRAAAGSEPLPPSRETR